jgi:hypothetical protein
MIGLRFKANNSFSLDSDVLAFFKNGTNTFPKSRQLDMENYYSGPGFSSNQASIFSATYSFNNPLTGLPKTLFMYFTPFTALFNISPQSSLLSISPFSILNSVTQLLSFNFRLQLLPFTNYTSFLLNSADSPASIFRSKGTTLGTHGLYSSSENEGVSRFSRFTNPIISYDYKCGNYIGIWDKLYPSMMTSFIEVARGIRKSP